MGRGGELRFIRCVIEVWFLLLLFATRIAACSAILGGMTHHRRGLETHKLPSKVIICVKGSESLGGLLFSALLTVSWGWRSTRVRTRSVATVPTAFEAAIVEVVPRRGVMSGRLRRGFGGQRGLGSRCTEWIGRHNNSDVGGGVWFPSGSPTGWFMLLDLGGSSYLGN